jgi:hypothetical protein
MDSHRRELGKEEIQLIEVRRALSRGHSTEFGAPVAITNKYSEVSLQKEGKR